jgi:hypothetical protein
MQSGSSLEIAYLELKSTILGGRVLRARTPAGLEQAIYPLLVTYQALRIAIADATIVRPDLDPDRGSFTVTLHAARDQVIKAAEVIAETSTDLVGAIGRQVLNWAMSRILDRSSGFDQAAAVAAVRWSVSASDGVR